MRWLATISALCLLVACTQGGSSDSPASTPNFLIILVDDLGYDLTVLALLF